MLSKAIASREAQSLSLIHIYNEVAVENLKKMAAQKGYSCDSSKLDDGSYSVKDVYKRQLGSSVTMDLVPDSCEFTDDLEKDFVIVQALKAV